MKLRRHSMSQLKEHLRFHFKKPEKLKNNVKKKMHLRLQLMVHLTMQSRVQLWISLCVLYILYRAEETELLTFQIRFGSRRSQVFTAVYRKRLIHIFFIKIADQQPEKRRHQRCFPVKLPNISELFFAKHVWVVATTKYHSFSLLRWSHQQNATLDFSYIIIIFKYFQSKHYESLVNSCFWKS